VTEIFLDGLEFYAHHGYYTEEQSLGNRFQVDLKILAPAPQEGYHEKLGLTVDYVKVYSVVNNQMKIKFKLLETLGERIIHEIVAQFPDIDTIEVTISKFNPPISGLCKRVAVKRVWNKSHALKLDSGKH
jgi:dihydroneopterin aldolase